MSGETFLHEEQETAEIQRKHRGLLQRFCNRTPSILRDKGPKIFSIFFLQIKPFLCKVYGFSGMMLRVKMLLSLTCV